jgi:hypothetical protein
MFLRNVGQLSMHCTALCSRGQHSLYRIRLKQIMNLALYIQIISLLITISGSKPVYLNEMAVTKLEDSPIIEKHQLTIKHMK